MNLEDMHGPVSTGADCHCPVTGIPQTATANFFQVFMFAEEKHAAFGGERMHPSERGKGARWAQWRKRKAPAARGKNSPRRKT